MNKYEVIKLPKLELKNFLEKKLKHQFITKYDSISYVFSRKKANIERFFGIQFSFEVYFQTYNKVTIKYEIMQAIISTHTFNGGSVSSHYTHEVCEINDLFKIKVT